MGNMSKALEVCGSNGGLNECSNVDKPSKMFEYLRSSGLTREKMNSIKLWKRSFGDLFENFGIKKSKSNCYKIKKIIMRKFSTEHQPANIKDSSDSISVRFEGNEISREINVHTIPESCRSPIPEENTIDIVTGRNISSGTRKSDKSIDIATGRNVSSSFEKVPEVILNTYKYKS
ncbi:hypothetical protein JTB14_004092 [Gonioctena quinquepunctata]|nr:hypothetical protein JTB14_004092 [Gonioctena quinquepunctata]